VETLAAEIRRLKLVPIGMSGLPVFSGYKALTRYQQTTIDWLAAYDDGEPTSLGFVPD
jgi:hypothetical protein